MEQKQNRSNAPEFSDYLNGVEHGRMEILEELLNLKKGDDPELKCNDAILYLMFGKNRVISQKCFKNIALTEEERIWVGKLLSK